MQNLQTCMHLFSALENENNKLLSHVWLFAAPWTIYSPWNSPGQNTRVGSFPLLQGIFPTQGSNPGFPHCRQVLYQLSHKGSPRILEWVVYPFSSRSSWLRNRTGVSCIAGDSLPTILLEPNGSTKQNIIPKAVELILFSSAHRTFSRIHHMLGHTNIWPKKQCLRFKKVHQISFPSQWNEIRKQ